MEQSGEFQRGLKSRHVTMLAIGGVIGTGLFLGTGYTVSQAGGGGAPLAYLAIGIVVYFLIYSLGEMATYMPVAGSFQTYSDLFVSPALGFALGWNYWLSFAVTIAAEMVAAAVIMKGFFPGVPPFVWCVVLGALILALNLFTVKAFGEAEFWFAGIKVVTIFAFIITGILLVLGLVGTQGFIGFSNLAPEKGGLFPNGMWAVVMVAFSAVFSYGGTEIVGIAAGEAENPEKTIPRAVRTVFIRILLFYVGSIAIIGLLVPYSAASTAQSPYAMVFELAGMPTAAIFMNIVILTSLSSGANAALYVCSRTLTALAKEGKAPAIFAKINERGVPAPAIWMTMFACLITVLTNFFSPDKVFVWLLTMLGLAIVFSWFGIAISHYNFRKWLVKNGGKVENLKFKASFYPLGPIIVMATCLIVLVGQFASEAGRLTVALGVPLFITLILIGKWLQHNGKLIRPNVDIQKCNERINNVSAKSGVSFSE